MRTAVTGFLVRMGVWAARNSRTAGTNSVTASSVSTMPTGETPRGNGFHGHTKVHDESEEDRNQIHEWRPRDDDDATIGDGAHGRAASGDGTSASAAR